MSKVLDRLDELEKHIDLSISNKKVWTALHALIDVARAAGKFRQCEKMRKYENDFDWIDAKREVFRAYEALDEPKQEPSEGEE